jgi:hypothetical protein
MNNWRHHGRWSMLGVRGGQAVSGRMDRIGGGLGLDKSAFARQTQQSGYFSGSGGLDRFAVKRAVAPVFNLSNLAQRQTSPGGQIGLGPALGFAPLAQQSPIDREGWLVHGGRLGLGLLDQQQLALDRCTFLNR